MTALNRSPNLTFMPEPAAVKRWTVADYHRMGELGILRPDERTELIAGQVLFMTSKGTAHVLALRLLATVLDRLVADLPFFVSTQDPIQLDDFSEPEPDCAIVHGVAVDYVDRHPSAREVVLVVEVADSTLKYDTEVKDKFYGRSGVAEYWVLDVKGRRLHVFREPIEAGYASHVVVDELGQVSPLAFPDFVVRVVEVLPPLA